MSIDIERIRRDTPGCANVIHLHNSGAALMPRPVYAAMIDHLERELANGGYEAATEAAPALERTYQAIARLINAGPTSDASGEIALVESATVAWNRCFLALTQNYEPGDHILIGRSEYASNYIAMLQLSERQGVKIDIVPDDTSGTLDVGALEQAITSRTKLICVTHVPTSGAVVNPAEAIGQVAAKHGLVFLLDACQSVGQMPLNVEAIGCHALSATGRKFLRGPRGTGFLYVRRSLLETLTPLDLDLHGASWTGAQAYETYPGAQRFEYFEGHVAGQVALGVAVEYALAIGLDEIWARVQCLANYLRERIEKLPDFELLDTGRVRSAIVTFRHRRRAPADVAAALRRRGINVGTSDMRATRLDLESRAPEGLVRAPVHYYNTHAELDRCIDCLRAWSSNIP